MLPVFACAGVVIRYRGTCHNCEECLRATVGTREENDLLLEKLVRVRRCLLGLVVDVVALTL